MSKKVLFIKATPLSEAYSRSTHVAKVFIEAYKKANATAEIVEKDLYQMDIPLIDVDVLSGWDKLASGEILNDIEVKKTSKIDALTSEFMAVDKVIIQSPMWNLGIPPLLKAYIDTITIAGKTFKYTEKGPVGLLTNKKAIHIHGSGGIYSNRPGTEYSDSFIKGILAFLGVEVLPTIWVEGIDYQPEKKDEIMNAVLDKAKQIALTF